MEDLVPRVQDLPHVQDTGTQVLTAGWHKAPAGVSPLRSPPTASAAAKSSIHSFPADPWSAPGQGLLCLVRVAQHRDGTASMLREEGGRGCKAGVGIGEERRLCL